MNLESICFLFLIVVFCYGMLLGFLTVILTSEGVAVEKYMLLKEGSFNVFELLLVAVYSPMIFIMWLAKKAEKLEDRVGESRFYKKITKGVFTYKPKDNDEI